MSDNFDNSQQTATQTQTETSKEVKCRYCKTVKKPHVKWDDPIYCSGKCRKLDGAESLPVKPGDTPKPTSATLLDYKKNPKRYHRRLDPERLNWGEVLTPKQLKQAGLRANREPIPGDWDYVEEQIPKTVSKHCILDPDKELSVTVTPGKEEENGTS